MVTESILLFSTLLYHLRLGEGSFPKPLSRKEEQYYLELASKGDVEARNVLIERNLRLVAHILKKYYANSADQEDLISIGTIGLMKGISTFKPEKGARLATYCARCVENEILMYFRSHRRMAQEVSLSEDIDQGHDQSALSLMDVLCDETDLLEEVSNQEQIRQMYASLKNLEEREREVLVLRYGLGGHTPLPQREVAQRLHLSRSYISRIEKKALEKLRAALS